MDFFHCNSCFSQPGPPTNSKFFLTNCGHSFCSECVNNSNVPLCRVCKARCKIIPLSSDLNDQLKLYFGDMVKEVKHLLNVLLIQNKHCKIYMDEYATKLEASFVERNKELNKIKAEFSELSKRYQELSIENQALKKSKQLFNIQRNKSPFGYSNLNEDFNRNQSHISTFLTPSPSSASGFSLSNQRLNHGRSAFSTPESLPKNVVDTGRASSIDQDLKSGEPMTRGRHPIPGVNSQPFLLVSDSLTGSLSNRSRGNSTPKSWSSGSSSRTVTKTRTIRKSGDNCMQNFNKCDANSIF